MRGVWGPGGADAFFGKGGEGVAECRAGQDAWQGAEAFGAGELRRLFGAEDPTLDLILVEGSGSGAQGRRICKPSACATVVEPSRS